MSISPKSCALIGAAIQSGASQKGCLMGPDALRTGGIVEAIQELGHTVHDMGNIHPVSVKLDTHPNRAIWGLENTVGWAIALEKAAYEAANNSDFPIFIGGDHSMSIGTIPGIARASEVRNQKQFLLWLDAHPDIHTLQSTQSGNLHGTVMAYVTGMSGFEKYYPSLRSKVDPKNVCMIGLRSVDEPESKTLKDGHITVYDMRAIDESGIINPLEAFLRRVADADGALHVSLDVDFLDPEIAPAVGTTVPGGATFREAHLIMEMLCDSGLVSSLDIVELNPFLDERGKTTRLMIDLCASLLGRTVLDRPTVSY